MEMGGRREKIKEGGCERINYRGRQLSHLIFPFALCIRISYIALFVAAPCTLGVLEVAALVGNLIHLFEPINGHN